MNYPVSYAMLRWRKRATCCELLTSASGVPCLQIIRAFGIACSNPEIVRELPEELPRRPSEGLVEAEIPGSVAITAAGLLAVIGEVRIVWVTVLVVIPPVAVCVGPVSPPRAHGRRADRVDVVARGGLVDNPHLIGARVHVGEVRDVRLQRRSATSHRSCGNAPDEVTVAVEVIDGGHAVSRVEALARDGDRGRRAKQIHRRRAGREREIGVDGRDGYHVATVRLGGNRDGA